MGTSVLRALLFIVAAASTTLAAEVAKLDSWVLVGDHGKHNEMSGSTRDLQRTLELAGDGPALWARRSGAEWLIRDPKILARARALAAPLDELGQEMAPLGKKQGKLGEKQAELGRQMRELSADPEHNGDAMAALGRKMTEIGDRQSAIGREQQAIGKRMEAAAHELEDKLGALVDEARAAGLAQKL
jgi:hypothetical protein